MIVVFAFCKESSFYFDTDLIRKSLLFESLNGFMNSILLDLDDSDNLLMAEIYYLFVLLQTISLIK